MKLSRVEGVTLILLAVGAAAIMLACTRWGVATSSDSARYVRTARHILGTEPIIDTGEPAHEQAHYPPGYPFALAAAGMVTRSDPLQAARWLHVMLFMVNVMLVALLTRRIGRTAMLFAAAITLIAPVSIFIHSWLLSESLFVTCSLLAILLLTRHLENPHAGLLIAAAIVSSLGMMARYAGAATGPAAIAAILLLDRRPWRKRLIDAAIFAGVFMLLPIAWMIRNVRLGGSATNRDIAFHPLSIDHVKDAIATLSIWLSPFNVAQPRTDANAHPLVAGIALLVFLAVIVVGVIWTMKRRDLLAGVTTLYIASFLILLALSISFVDFHTPADTRVLSPIFFAWVTLGACILSAKPRAAVGVGALLLVLLIVPSVRLINRLAHEGDGFAHAQWQQSPTIAAVRELPLDMQIFTNAPGAVYLLTGRQLILTVPAETSASSRLPNPDYPALMERIESELHAGRGVLVYLRRYGARRTNYPTEDQLKRKLGLHPMGRFSDGTIFDYVAPATTTTTTTTQP